MTDELFCKQYHAPAGFVQPHRLSGRPPETPLLVAFSGGADSRLLLELAVIYGKAYGAPVYAAHLHHGIRGDEADRDERFCREVAQRLDVPLFVEHADIPGLAAASGRSLEWEAREMRYAFFARIMMAHDIPLLLTGHHADDQLETLLLRMVRGTGTKGMGGIPPVRPLSAVPNGLLLRPLLDCPKASVLDGCRELGLSFVTDSTNEATDATRNRIRHEVIPALERMAGDGVPQRSALRLAQHAREDDAYLTEQGRILYERANCGPNALRVSAITEAPRPVAKRALNEAYLRVANDHLSTSHMDALLSLCHRGIQLSAVTLPHEISAVLRDGTLVFDTNTSHMDAHPIIPPCTLPVGNTPWDGGRIMIHVEVLPAPATPCEGEDVIASAVFPADKLPLPLRARQRQPGDVLRHHGVGRKLKKLLCDKDVPVSLRDRIPLICTQDEIPLWFPTAGFADGYPPPAHGSALRITVQSVIRGA